MTELQLEGWTLIAVVVGGMALMTLPALCRYAVDAGRYRHLCLTRRGALRLALEARRQGYRGVRAYRF